MGDKVREGFYNLLKLIFPLKWIWCIIPAILGVFFVYWAKDHSEFLISKEHQEALAIYLMSIAVIIYLVRSLLYRFEIDYILLAISINFLCREIHFTGTDNGVVIVAALILAWIFYRRGRIWEIIENAKVTQIAMLGSAFTYFFAILIQRNVFTAEHLPFLHKVELNSIELEEVMENIAHLYLIFIGVASFFSIRYISSISKKKSVY